MFSEISSFGEETFETMSIGVFSSHGKFSTAVFSSEHFSLSVCSDCMSKVLSIVAGVVVAGDVVTVHSFLPCKGL